MAIQTILTSDKVQVFRTKHNSSVNEIWVSGVDNGDGTLTFTKFDGGTVTIDISNSFFTKAEIADLLIALTPASYTNLGSIEIATTEEVNEGSSEELAIVPFTASNSTLFPFKGIWDSDKSADDFYLTDFVVHHEGSLYVSLFGDLTTANTVEPGTDPAKWEKIGSTPVPVAYSNADLVNDPPLGYYLPVSKTATVLEIKYKVTASDKTYRRSTESALEEDTEWATNRIYGFPADDITGIPLAQTITITTI